MTLMTTETAAESTTALHTVTQRVITQAVIGLWPDKQVILGPQCPSVTSYVCRVTVDGDCVNLGVPECVRRPGSTAVSCSRGQCRRLRWPKR